MERGRTELTNNYDEERLNSISRSLQWRSDGILISPSDYSFLRERIDTLKRNLSDRYICDCSESYRCAASADWGNMKQELDDAQTKLQILQAERDGLLAARMQMMLERNDARWWARLLFQWAVASFSDNDNEELEAWLALPISLQQAILGD